MTTPSGWPFAASGTTVALTTPSRSRTRFPRPDALDMSGTETATCVRIASATGPGMTSSRREKARRVSSETPMIACSTRRSPSSR